MPRRLPEVLPTAEPAKKRIKVSIEDTTSLDVSFFDDEALPPGIIFNDVQLKRWRIGKPIGRGSFGRIYLASDDVDKEVTKQNAKYVVKIEPHTNGPLFVEIHCLIRTAQSSKVKEWRQQNKHKHFGMPVFIANGSFTDSNSGIKYRFLILPRYDKDLQKIIARTRVLDQRNVSILAIQILDVLEYLHGQGYTHSDIKSSNLMLGFDTNKVFKTPFSKPSFQKETKEVGVMPSKHRKSKPGKCRTSNYYDDEDFIVKSGLSLSPQSEKEKKLASVKNKLRKILSDKDSRTLHRHHAFNLRQLSSYVNYEDFDSSVCSDQSYQKLVDDYESKRLAYSSDEGFHDDPKFSSTDEIHKEAVLLQSSGQIYLLDYGLASKFLDSNGNHKDFGMDARKAHDGTLEYSSRDSHIGAHSRRSDLETLGYNLLDWLTGTLPWKRTEMLAEPDLVHALKKNFMSDVKLLLKTCFKTEFYPSFLEKYFEYITSLDFTEKPDYDYCRSIFKGELSKNGSPDKEFLLKFSDPPMLPMNRKKMCYSKRFNKKNTGPDFMARNGVKKAYERENITSLENDLKLELLKHTLNTSSDGIRKPCSSRNFFISDADLVARLKKSLMPHDILGKKLSPKNLRSKKRTIKRRKGKKTHRSSIGKFGNFLGSAKQFTWAEILAGNPEDFLRKDRNVVTDDDNDDTTCKYRIRKLSNASSEGSSSDNNLQSPLLQKDYLHGMNPTYAMKEVIANFKKKVSGKKEVEDTLEGYEGYTPAMIKLKMAKEKREAKEVLEFTKPCLVKIADIVPRSMRSSKKVTSKVRKTSEKSECKEKADDILDVVKSRCSNKKTSAKKNTKNKKDEKIVETTVEIETTPKSKSIQTKKTREVAVPINRRRLRSSKRKK